MNVGRPGEKRRKRQQPLLVEIDLDNLELDSVEKPHPVEISVSNEVKFESKETPVGRKFGRLLGNLNTVDSLRQSLPVRMNSKEDVEDFNPGNTLPPLKAANADDNENGKPKKGRLLAKLF